jgi:hypothetical protein
MLIGKELGPYLVDKELGSGAMGTVFRAKNQKNGERVAIKLLSLHLGTNENAINRFKREIDIIKQLDHPNIVRYINSGRYHKAPFIIMEFIQGESLDHILHRRTRLPWEEVVNIGVNLCAGLQHAHDQGIIHRDLKPSNLMILKDGTVKLTDFGIAKDEDVTALTAANSTVGTAAYMSPEQCRGVRDITHKTDLYSMGIMFYELLTGRKPFSGETPMEVFLQHANKTDYKRPAEIVMEVPVWLNTLVDQLMEKEPAKRPISAKAVAESLQLITEKVAAQRSAGVEAATKRKIDRARGDKKLDEEDKAAARVMLGKKKKTKVTPFYAKGWFTVLALMLVALLAAVGVYFVFLRVPSADSLFAQVEALARSGSNDDRDAADMFLRHYPAHEKASRVQQLADRFDFETLERQMNNRRNSPLKFERGAEEQAFNRALDTEKDGKMADAIKIWQDLRANKTNADREMRAWGLLGEHYLQDHKDADELYKHLQRKANSKEAPSPDPIEQLALEAVQSEREKDLTEAKTKWAKLAKTPELPRRWFLLARKQEGEMDRKITKSKPGE